VIWTFLAILLVAIAVILIMAEAIVPSGGLISMTALVCGVSGILIAFLKVQDQALGFGLIVGGVVLAPVAFLMGLSRLPRTRFGRRIVLRDAALPGLAASPGEANYQDLLGRTGTAVSYLRPAGIAEFDGRRFDVVTEGDFVPEGTPVKVVRVEAQVIVVRPIEVETKP
jgi:membrane-bound serine protease (ClpP class)